MPYVGRKRAPGGGYFPLYLSIALAGHKGKQGDTAYREYKFTEALGLYEGARGIVSTLIDARAKRKELASIEKKIGVTKTTGTAHLASQVKALLDVASFYNLKDEVDKAKKTATEAREMIKSSPFATRQIKESYNETAAVVQTNRLYIFPTARHRDVITIGGIEFVYIKGGEFMMGSPDGTGEANQRPRHSVTVSGFWMGRYEVTQQQYEAVMGENPSHFKGDGRRPVENVSWDDASSFCERYGAKEGVTARLPTEAEWEFAARAGTTTAYYWGDSIDGDYCWYSTNAGSTTHSVGEKRPNAWGLYDMAGNVWEWCADWYGDYGSSPEVNPQGPTWGESRVLRGGSWDSGIGIFLRSAYRFRLHPTGRRGDWGFRAVVAAGN